MSESTKSVELELLRVQERLRTTLSSMSDLIFALDVDGKYSEFHQPADRPELAMPPEQFLGKHYRECLPPSICDQLDEALARIQAPGDREQFEYTLQTQENRQGWFSTRISGRWPAGELDGYTCIVQDITERKMAELELCRSRDELEAVNAELQRFVHTVSHDLRSPLVTLRGFLGMLRQDVGEHLDERIESDLRMLDDATDKMARTLDDLLQLSRAGRVIDTPTPEPLADMVAEALKALDGLLTEQGVEVDVAPDLPAVTIDRSRFPAVLQNLCENAARYMGDQPRPRIEIRAVEEEERTLVVVADNGIGIDPAHHKKVFGLFERLDPTTPGTGIGLSVVQRIVEAHGGKVWVESEGKGCGTRFVVALPREAAAA